LRLGFLRLKQGQEETLRFALYDNRGHAARRRSGAAQQMAGVDTDEATDSEDDDAIGVYLRIGIKTLNFSNFPTPGDESSDELSESEEDERAHWSTQSSGEIPVVVPSRTKDKQRVSDSDSEEDLTSSDLSDTEEDSQEEEEQLRQNEAKRLATKLQEGANFLLVTRKHGVRPSHVRLSGDQRTIICRRHTSTKPSSRLHGVLLFY
jgi:hypothetical protein